METPRPGTWGLCPASSGAGARMHGESPQLTPRGMRAMHGLSPIPPVTGTKQSRLPHKLSSHCLVVFLDGSSPRLCKPQTLRCTGLGGFEGMLRGHPIAGTTAPPDHFQELIKSPPHLEEKIISAAPRSKCYKRNFQDAGILDSFVSCGLTLAWLSNTRRIKSDFRL